jgi:hypothetical protein
MSRAGWLGWCASALLYFPSLSQRLQMRLVITILVMSVIILPIVQMEPFAEEISSRIESFTDAKDDTSLSDRRAGYEALFGKAVNEWIGRGLGGGLESTPLGGSDSSILPVLFKFGWLGTVPFVGGIVLIFLKIFQFKSLSYDPFASAAKAIAIGIFAQLGFNLIFSNVFAFVLWGFLGISLGAGKYYQVYAPRHLPFTSRQLGSSNSPSNQPTGTAAVVKSI